MMLTMNKLIIEANDSPVVLERVLQVIRYRGFRVCNMHVFQRDINTGLQIEVSLKSDKSIENLKHQIAKIIDIQQIKVEDQLQQQITA